MIMLPQSAYVVKLENAEHKGIRRPADSAIALTGGAELDTGTAALITRY